MIEAFVDVKFHRDTLELINNANTLLAALLDAGYRVTLRQLFYQLVSRDVIPNTQKSYKRLGEIINNARLAGLIDWDAIEDRTRGLRGVSHHDDPADVIQTAASGFRLDKWEHQKNRVEVWVEKDALVGVLEKACRPLDVDWFSCRGYTSQSAVYRAAKRFIGYCEDGQNPVIIHLGDHDPSGMDMTRDIFDRLTMFVTEATGHEIEIKRVALNMPQIIQYHPPPNPAKVTDSRYEGYMKKHGKNSWELDALEPAVIDKLITDTVLAYRDEDQWKLDEEREKGHRDLLQACASDWEDVSGYVAHSERYLKTDDLHDIAPRDPNQLRDELHRFARYTDNPIVLVNDGRGLEVNAEALCAMLTPPPKPKKKTSSFKTKSTKKKPKK